jgi:hypothetical protein
MQLYPNKSKDFGYLYIEDLYTKNELESIKTEIKHLSWVLDNVPNAGHLRQDIAGRNADGSTKMTGTGILIDHTYSNRDYSSILNYNRKVFNEEISDVFMKTHPANTAYKNITKDYTMLNKYSHNNENMPHQDNCSFSIVTFLTLEKKSIKGGDFVFTDYKERFKFKDNSCVIFPSWVMHHATKLKSQDVCRYSLAQTGEVHYINYV